MGVPGGFELPESEEFACAAEPLNGDPGEAEQLIGKALNGDEDDAEAPVRLAAAIRSKGGLETAVALLDRLAAAKPEAWAVQGKIGRTLLALGRSREAAGRLERALALNPDWADGWRLLGDVRRLARDFDAARATDDQILRLMSEEPAALAAAEAMIRGDFETVERTLVEALRASPHSLAIAHLLGQVIWRRLRFVDAERLLGACLNNAPDFEFLRLCYAELLVELGWHGPASEQADAVLARDPASIRGRIVKCAALSALGEHAAACDLKQTLLDEFPDQAASWIGQGYALATLGRYDDGVAAFKTAMALDPKRGGAYLGLSSLKTYRFTPEEEALMRARLAGADLEEADRAAICFALAKAREDAQGWEDAFALYSEGNRRVRALRPHHPTYLPGIIERCRKVYTPAFFEQRRGWGCPSPEPIFIVGLPRAGSTLIEQILSSHPAIEGTRELEDLQQIATFLIGRDIERYPKAFAETPPEAFAELGRNFLEWTKPLRRQQRPRFIDKSPINFIHVGLIQLLLPNAKIIDARRHPLGCGFSAFKEHFADGWEFAFDLEDIGRYYAEYVELMALYDEVLPGRVHRVIYEEMVDDTEAQVRALLDYLELPFDEACLKFHENRRAVATPSAEQVRQPIYASAKAHWKNFEPWLGPLKAALGPTLDTYPAPPPR
jgi:tetratricopeptide (TPR) repeat protein